MTDLDRPQIDETLLEMAHVMSLRGTCPYIQVGTVIARDGRILSSGYNGAPSGMPHCDHGPRDPAATPVTCPTAIHAESNAIAFAARYGTSLLGATLYTTLTPCKTCAQLIIQVGITRVVASALYRDPAGMRLLDSVGLRWFMRGPRMTS